jgi:hypothetical protein
MFSTYVSVRMRARARVCVCLCALCMYECMYACMQVSAERVWKNPIQYRTNERVFYPSLSKRKDEEAPIMDHIQF